MAMDVVQRSGGGPGGTRSGHQQLKAPSTFIWTSSGYSGSFTPSNGLSLTPALQIPTESAFPKPSWSKEPVSRAVDKGNPTEPCGTGCSIAVWWEQQQQQQQQQQQSVGFCEKANARGRRGETRRDRTTASNWKVTQTASTKATTRHRHLRHQREEPATGLRPPIPPGSPVGPHPMA
ncbi:hypothetical protein BO70DRAFT_365520 [Aspergillus heteromorphus CBS 117.55]|uniref:Uncharacterized protein n=1 Tax=Aspergillus heteromorphus CBS 117.55 TaxID=1448321 RepID=A0A317V833_9EURO|nr:uncharacterized protein BO70DRAFT_365520 [Aspergillus heteromorphus CBS 117.55]PWY70215.1 hypothetical protein BO70DRAFT_365520 [Aspergillus heteromorphus CBS 117.55]